MGDYHMSDDTSSSFKNYSFEYDIFTDVKESIYQVCQNIFS